MRYFFVIIRNGLRLFISKVRKHMVLRRNAAIIKKYKTVYCVIRRGKKHVGEGLFACFLEIIKSLYLVKNTGGIIPVVDMQTYKNPYLRIDEVGEVNAYELFFKQPCNITLKDIERCKNVFYCPEPSDIAFPCDSMEFLTNQDEIEFWRKFCNENISLSEEAERYISRKSGCLKKIKEKKTLGVWLRGSDYAQGKPYNHPVVPSIQESIEKTKEILQEKHCEQIFLSAEDQSYHDAFLEEFGDKVLYIEQLRYSGNISGGIMLTEQFNDSDIRDTGYKYLTAVFLTSKCDCLFAARCCGSIGALLFSDGYEYTYFWNRGRYHVDHFNQVEL